MKRKGFTLVELLIVIAIIGTLTALMTLSSTNATASAEAAKVVNALRTAKTAALMYYWDHPDMQTAKKSTWETATTGLIAKFAAEIPQYLEATPDGAAAGTAYTLKLVPPTGATDDTLASAADWYVGYTVKNNAKITDAVKARLAGQGASYGLYGIGTDGPASYAITDTVIYMKVRTGVTASTATETETEPAGTGQQGG